MAQATDTRILRYQHSSVRRWCQIQGLGGLLLACCFFLPAVKSCNSPVVPLNGVIDDLDISATSLGDLALGLLIFTGPYLFGLLTCLVIMRNRRYTSTPTRWAGVSVTVFVAVVIVLMVMAISEELILGGGDRMVLLVSVLTAFAVLHWRRSIRQGPGGSMCTRWCAAMACLLWFGYWVLGGDAMYGMWLSIVGATMIAAGCFAEARIRAD